MSKNKYKNIDGITVVHVEPTEKKAPSWDDNDNLKKILGIAFPRHPILDMNILYQTSVEGLKEIKITDGYNLYNVSQIVGTKAGLKTDHWILSVLRVDYDTNQVVFKYVHPETMEVFDDPNLVNIETLPQIN